jgi:hypothetical protein
MRTKLPISALVASCNEGHLLEDCLKSLDFCDEIFFIDIASKDNSVEIAKKYAHVIEEHEFVNRIGKIHPIFIPKLKNDWFILIDPDERIRPELAESIKEYISNPVPFVSLIRAPILYLFKGKRLKGGPYKDVIMGRLLFFRPGILVTNQVHEGIFAKAGFGKINIELNGKNYDEHYWCNSWEQLKNKHDRYTASEGERLYLKGESYSFLNKIYKTISMFIEALFVMGYIKDGVVGFGISYYEARYVWLSWKNLGVLEEKLKKEKLFLSKESRFLKLMHDKLEELKDTTNQFIKEYNLSDNKTKISMLAQYQKSIHRIYNDALELNAFNMANNILQIANFNSEMSDFIIYNLTSSRLKLIQNSGSYKLARKLASIIKRN